jgi:hypothetical protein
MQNNKHINYSNGSNGSNGSNNSNNSNIPVDYNVNVVPLLADYNHTNNGVSPLIPSDNKDYNSLVDIRGYGLYNPAPLHLQTTDRGHAFSKTNTYSEYFDKNYVPVTGNLYVNPSGAVDVEGTWQKNINYDIKPPDGDNYEYYDEYQRWALNVVRKADPYILPFLFSKVNVKFIQDSVVQYIKKARNITINTRQDVDNLLNLMLNNYILFYQSSGIFTNNDCANNSYENSSCDFSSILSNLNKNIIEKYVQNVLSASNMYEYYMKDISTLPVPLSNPVLISNKGSNVLGYVGPYEDNQNFTRIINSFNMRDTVPDKINSTKFGN